MSHPRRRTPLRLDALEDRSVPSAAAPIDPASYVPDRILVRLKADAPRILAAVAPGADLDRPLALVDGLWGVRLAPGQAVAAALAAARANPFVMYAEPDYLLHAATVPNDPKYADGTLWGMNKIAMPAAWDVSTGGSTVVAVIDTGVDYTHPDLAANIWTNPGEVAGDGIDNDHNGFVDDIRGWDFANNDNNPMDDHSHGTHVSGTIAGVGNNGVGVVGVNWAAQIMPVKFLDASGSGTTEAAIQALNYAVMMGARVSNHSYGDNAFSQAHLDAITAAGLAGHLVVAGAGNGDFLGRAINNDTTPFFPASYQPTPDNVISVAATDSTDKFASFSNYGAQSVDLAAPGVNIYSTVPGGYGTKSGTSMATPHVVGAAALIWAADPSLAMDQVRGRLLAGTDSIQALNPSRPTVTNGRLNVARAMPQTPRLSVSDATITEGDSGPTAATFTVTLSPASSQTVTVDYATADGTATAAGLDYTTASGPLTFAPGETSKTVTVDVLGDTLPEANETFTLNLSNAAGAPILDGQGVGTIVDNDSPGHPPVQHGGVQRGGGERRHRHRHPDRRQPGDGDGRLRHRERDGRHQRLHARHRHPDVRARGDVQDLHRRRHPGHRGRGERDGQPVADERDRRGGPRRTATAVLTIVDDDPPPAVSISDFQALEGNSGTKSFTFTVTLANPSSQTVTVSFATANGTANGGSLTAPNRDYVTASGSVVFDPGETTKTITVLVRGDNKREASETFFVNLSSPTNATLLDAQGLGTIVNDD